MPLPAQNKFLNNSFFIFITRFFPSLANLLVVIWFSRALPPEQYGDYQLFWIQLYVLYPLITLGMHNLVITYTRGMLANILASIRKRHYVRYLLWALAISILFGWLQYYTGSVSFLVSFLFILAFSASVVTESLLIVFRKFITLSVSGLLYALLFCLAHVYALSTQMPLPSLFSLLLSLTMLRLFVYSIAILREVKKDGDGYDAETLDIASIRTLWLHLGLYDVVQVLSSWIDKFIISLLLTADLSAIYYNGAQNIPFIPLMVSAAGSAVLLQMAGAQQQSGSTASLLRHSGRIMSCIVFPVFGFLYYFRNELIVNLLSAKYIESIPIFAASLLVLPVRAYNFTSLLQSMHKGNIINAGAVMELVLACLLMYPFYLWLGLPGVALAFVVTTYLQAAFYLFYSARLLRLSPLSLVPLVNWVSKLIVFSFLFIAIHHYGGIHFTGRFTLILGAFAMLILIGVSLLAEVKLEKKNGYQPTQVPKY